MQSQIVNTAERAQQVLKRLEESKVVVIDSETSGLSWLRNHIVGHVLTFGPAPSDSVYVPVRHAGDRGQNLPGTYVPMEAESNGITSHWFEEEMFKSIRRNPDILSVFHNAAYDLDMYYRHDIDFARSKVECTMVTAALLNENARAYSLSACCKRTGVQEKKGDELYLHMSNLFGGESSAKAQMGNFWRLGPEDPLGVDYATGDGTSTYQLWEKYQRGIVSQGLETVHDLEKRVTPLLHRMKRIGIKINEEELEKVLKEVQDKIEELGRKFEGINISSGKQLYKFFSDRGITNFAYTEKGNVSITEPWLEKFELGQDLLRVRKYKNLRDSFIRPLKERHVIHGRMYPSFNQLRGDENGVITGRLSSSEPNMQGIPKRNKELGRIFRKVFIPDDGHVWASSDYSQQEYRMFTDYANSPALFEAYEKGSDFHQVVADMLGVERDPTAKRINLGVLYGMGLEKLAAALGVTVEVAEDYRKKHRKMVPEATKFMKKSQEIAKSQGYVTSILGRRRRFPRGEFAHKAGNAIIQMSSADQTKLAMVRIQDYFDSVGSSSRVLLQVHDSIEASVVPGDEDHIVRIMEDHGPDSPMPMKVVVKCDYKTGSNYSEATYG